MDKPWTLSNYFYINKEMLEKEIYFIDHINCRIMFGVHPAISGLISHLAHYLKHRHKKVDQSQLTEYVRYLLYEYFVNDRDDIFCDWIDHYDAFVTSRLRHKWNKRKLGIDCVGIRYYNEKFRDSIESRIMDLEIASLGGETKEMRRKREKEEKIQQLKNLFYTKVHENFTEEQIDENLVEISNLLNQFLEEQELSLSEKEESEDSKSEEEQDERCLSNTESSNSTTPEPTSDHEDEYEMKRKKLEELEEMEILLKKKQQSSNIFANREDTSSATPSDNEENQVPIQKDPFDKKNDFLYTEEEPQQRSYQPEKSIEKENQQEQEINHQETAEQDDNTEEVKEQYVQESYGTVQTSNLYESLSELEIEKSDEGEKISSSSESDSPNNYKPAWKNKTYQRKMEEEEKKKGSISRAPFKKKFNGPIEIKRATSPPKTSKPKESEKPDKDGFHKVPIRTKKLDKNFTFSDKQWKQVSFQPTYVYTAGSLCSECKDMRAHKASSQSRKKSICVDCFNSSCNSPFDEY